MDGAAYFADARAAAVRLERLENQISGLEASMMDCWPTHDGNGPQRGTQGLSDPTWRGVLNIESCRRRIDWLQTEADGCRETIAECRRVLDGMASALGGQYKETMALYYLHPGASWQQVANDMRVTERTALRRRSVAIDWLSDVGLANAKAGNLTRTSPED